MTGETVTAYLDIHIVTPAIVWSDFYDEEPEAGTRDEFLHELEQAIASVVGKLLHVRRLDIESDWYSSAWLCPECGEFTAQRHERYGRDKGIYRVCGFGHKTPVDPIARTEGAS